VKSKLNFSKHSQRIITAPTVLTCIWRWQIPSILNSSCGFLQYGTGSTNRSDLSPLFPFQIERIQPLSYLMKPAQHV